MRPPEIEGAMYLAARGLLNDDFRDVPATIDELHDAVGWETTRDNLIKTIGTLRTRGLAEKVRITRSADDDGEETVEAYRLTADGRRGVQETLDYYTFKERPETARRTRGEILSVETIEESSDRPHRDRHPFPHELDLLLKEAAPEAGPPIRVILAARLHARDVCGLLVEDFDRDTEHSPSPGGISGFPRNSGPTSSKRSGRAPPGRCSCDRPERHGIPRRYRTPFVKPARPPACPRTWFSSAAIKTTKAAYGSNPENRPCE